MYANPSPRKCLTRDWAVRSRRSVAVLVALGVFSSAAVAQQPSHGRTPLLVLDVSAGSEDAAAWTAAFRSAFERIAPVRVQTRDEHASEIQSLLRTTRPRQPGDAMQQGVPLPTVDYYVSLGVDSLADSLRLQARAMDIGTSRIYARIDTVLARGQIPESLVNSFVRSTLRRSDR